MAALTVARNTIRYGAEPLPALLELKVKAATKCLGGGIAVIDAGYAAPGRTATGLIAVGRFQETKDNTSGAAGAITVKILQGAFKWANSTAGDLIAQADVGKTCYIVDDQTVAKTDGGATRSIAGKIVSVEADGGVFVLMGLAV